jgi:hypothetical protein
VESLHCAVIIGYCSIFLDDVKAIYAKEAAQKSNIRSIIQYIINTTQDRSMGDLRIVSNKHNIFNIIKRSMDFILMISSGSSFL